MDLRAGIPVIVTTEIMLANWKHMPWRERDNSPQRERPPAFTLMALLKTVTSEHHTQTEFDLALRAQSVDTRAISDPE